MFALCYLTTLCTLVQISLQDVVKIADVGVSKEEKMITGTNAGTPAIVAPEVIRSSVYDKKADIYSFGIMMWEMWYGDWAYRNLDVGGDLSTFEDRVLEGVRPSHIKGARRPPDQWQNLMQCCWDGEAEKRPTTATCHNALTKMYSAVFLSDVQLNVQQWLAVQWNPKPSVFRTSRLTRTKRSFPSSVEHYNFTPDFSNSPIFRTNVPFPWRFVKSGFHCIYIKLTSQTHYGFIECQQRKSRPYRGLDIWT